jgi:hypothetical protein
MTKKELLAKLSSSDELVKMAYVPVSEVIKWVDELEEESTTISNDLIDQIVEEIINLDLDLIDDYNLGMSYREVELEGVDINEIEVRRAVERAVRES